MATLDDMNENYKAGLAGAIHLLLIGPTKTGKSDYLAQAAIDGYQILYIDRDNGFETLMSVLREYPEARKRIHYFSPKNMPEFVESILTNGVARYNIRTRGIPEYTDKEDDRIIELYPARIPPGIILSLDSWTTLTIQLIAQQAERRKIDLMDVDKYSREIYSGTNYKATFLATLLQNCPFHVIVQGHGGYYERKEKPPGRAGSIAEKDMLIRETTEVVISTSMPHGATMGKYFNQVGWLSVNNMNQRILDFQLINGRMGGGTPNKSGDPHGSMRFATLFGKPPIYPDTEVWMHELSYEEMKAKAKGSSTLKPATTVTPNVATESQPTAATTAPRPTLPSFMRKG